MAPRPVEILVPAALRPRQKRFVDEYLVDLNATRAALRAGYAPSSAHVTSSRLLAKRHVRAHIEHAMAERFSVNKLSIVEELAAVAFHDIGDYVTWTEDDLRTVPSSKLTEWQLKAIASVRRTGPDLGCVELKLHDKLRALELLARVLGFLDNPAAGAAMDNVRFIIETP